MFHSFWSSLLGFTLLLAEQDGFLHHRRIALHPLKTGIRSISHVNEVKQLLSATTETFCI